MWSKAVKALAKCFSHINLKCHSQCCECDLDLSPEEYEEMIHEVLKISGVKVTVI